MTGGNLLNRYHFPDHYGFAGCVVLRGIGVFDPDRYSVFSSCQSGFPGNGLESAVGQGVDMQGFVSMYTLACYGYGHGGRRGRSLADVFDFNLDNGRGRVPLLFSLLEYDV